VLGADGHFYRRQVEGFADSVLSGAPMRGANIADGVANIKTMVAIAHSVASGKSVEVESAKGAL
jgi:predicted dehydrogenase